MYSYNKCVLSKCDPLPFLVEGLNLLPNFLKGGGSGLTRSQFLEGFAGKWGVTFFVGGCSFEK